MSNTYNEDLVTTDRDTIVRIAQETGIVGAGGAGFPTYVKLQSAADTYLVNAAECEPMLKVDQQLMVTQADALIRGLRYGMAATGAQTGIIATKQKYAAAIEALTPKLPEHVRIHILPDVYPAGDEVMTIWLATGRRVPPAKIPISIGVVVNNVQSLINLAHAMDDNQPVTHRTLTINGAVQKPMTVTVPIGITFRQLLDLAGGVTIPAAGYINGGPMMGKLVEDLDQPVTKTTGGLLVFPADHLLIQRRRRTDADILSMAKTVCEQCHLCTDLCPRHLIGHELSPHQLVRSMNYGHFADMATLTSALTCSECGVCENYACPVGISPMRINRILKQRLRAEHIRYEGELHAPDPMAPYRQVPIPRLVSRLDLPDYYHPAPMTHLDWQPERVTIPTQQHIGAPSTPIVAVGDTVECGQCIATAKADALSIHQHASIHGVVSDITDHFITITRG